MKLKRWIRFMRAAHIAYKMANLPGSRAGYGGVCDEFGVPRVAVFTAFDREAWRVTQRAIEEHQEKPQ